MDSKQLGTRVPFFRHVKAEELDRLIPHIELRTLKRGERYWHEGHLGDSFAFLLRGRVKSAKTTLGGREAITHLSGPGEMLCAGAVCEFKPHCCSATALEDETEVLAVPRRLLMDLFERSPAVARALLHEITQQSIAACGRIEELSSGQVEQRLATVLLKLTERAGVRRPDGLFIPIPLSRQDMADMCGTTVETCIRTLSRLRADGVLQTRSSGFLITDRVALTELARATDNLVPIGRRSQTLVANDDDADKEEEAPKERRKRAARTRR